VISHIHDKGQVMVAFMPILIINHFKLTFIADKPPPPWIASQEPLMAAEAGGEYFS
jgi:hypothetical protein